MLSATTETHARRWSPWATSSTACTRSACVTGIVGAATVVGAFLTGWPSIIAVILNYVKRSEARGTWLESHFRWQIRTFWFGLLWVALCLAFVVVTLGIGLAHRLAAARRGRALVHLPDRARLAAAHRSPADVRVVRGRRQSTQAAAGRGWATSALVDLAGHSCRAGPGDRRRPRASARASGRQAS